MVLLPEPAMNQLLHETAVIAWVYIQVLVKHSGNLEERDLSQALYEGPASSFIIWGDKKTP